VRVFTLSFHSPSLKPGCTAYVRDSAELEAFVRRCTEYFEFFRGELGGKPVTPSQLRALLTREPAAVAR
jgi:hypothetical protein